MPEGAPGREGIKFAPIDLTVVIVYAIGIFALAQRVSRDKVGTTKDTSD